MSSNNTESEQGENYDAGLQMEESSKGKVKGSVSLNYFKSGAHWSVVFLLAASFIVVQILASGADYWVSVWYEMHKSCTIQSILFTFSLKFFIYRIKQEEIRASQKVESSKLINDNNTTEAIFNTSLNSSAPTFSDSSSNKSQTWTLSTELCIYINAALVGGIFILGNIR